jgi:hypothetical protein
MNTIVKSYILDFINPLLAHKLLNYSYYDVHSEDAGEYELLTNGNIDIVAHQLKLVFEGEKTIFISWDMIEKEYAYCLAVSEKSFCAEDIFQFSQLDKKWERFIGQKLVDYKVYGQENIFLKKEGNNEMRTNAPHLLVLQFDNSAFLGIGNFYASDNFIPDSEMGDDIWIIFEENTIEMCVKKLQLSVYAC